MKATEQYFPVVLFIILFMVVLTFESVDEIQLCDHLNKSYWAVLSCETLYYASQGGSIFSVCGWHEILWCDRSIKSHWAYLLSSTYYCGLLDGPYFSVSIALIFSTSYLTCIIFLFIFFYSKDHNYGQPPPMTPPDSNSPGPEDGDTGNEDEEDDGVTRCIW